MVVPSTADILRQAVELHRAGQLQQAEKLYRQVLTADPNNHDAFHLLGLVAHQLGRNDQAELYVREALRLSPNFAEAHNSLGIALFHQKKIPDAIRSYELALLLKPDYTEARNNLAGAINSMGHALKDQGRLDEAIAHFQHAIRMAPRHVAAYCNMGYVLQIVGKMSEAEAYLREGLRIDPNCAAAHNVLGASMQSQGRWEEAEACYREAVRCQANFAEAYKNLANTLHHQRKFADAEQNYRAALRYKPDFAEAHADLGILKIIQGDFLTGWPEYEWRWKSNMMARFQRHFPQPLWQGQPLPTGTILLHVEQGFGDAMQAIRFAPLVKERVGTVLCECPRELVRLFNTCPGIDRVVVAETPLPAFDVHAPLMSLPGILRTTLETLPAQIPYLFADEKLVEHWRQELSGYPGFKIGIVWQGNPRQWDPQLRGADRIRSIPLAELRPLTQRKKPVTLFSLQKGFGSEQIAEVSDRFQVIDLGPRLNDFMDTAAVMKNLDLVITVDSSPAHLAGSLGIPVWVALPTASCWRWLLDREDTPWYPTMRLFRQKTLNDWSDVIARMAAELETAIAASAGIVANCAAP